MEYIDIITTSEGMQYDGKYHKYFYNKDYNFEYTYNGCLADCTSYVEGACQITGSQRPISRSCNANEWHNNLANGWFAIPFDESKLDIGDVIEWSGNGIHVARFEGFKDGVPYISGSFYTGSNGKAFDGGKFSERESIGTSAKVVSDWCFKNYPYRTFHYVPLETENSWVGQQPNYILKNPSVYVPHATRNSDKTQIEVFNYNHNVRSEASINGQLVGLARLGVYDVLKTKEADGYLWAKIGDHKYVAITGDVLLYEKGQPIPTPTPTPQPSDEIIEELNKLVKDLGNKMVALANDNTNLNKQVDDLKPYKEQINKIKEIVK